VFTIESSKKLLKGQFAFNGESESRGGREREREKQSSENINQRAPIAIN
jgi:hypothetical protein